jgi:hypothetical protein
MMAAWSFPLGILGIPSMIKAFTPPAVAILLTVGLMLWCDVELVRDAVLRKRRQAAQVPPSQRNLDWVVWIAAVALTAFCFWLSVNAVLYGRRLTVF